MADITETKAAVQDALDDADGINVEANLNAETIRLVDDNGDELAIDGSGALTVTGDVGVTNLPEPLDASGATITVADNGLFTIDGIDSTVQVSEDSALDVSGATVTVNDNGSFVVDEITSTVSVQENSPLDVSAATVTVTDDGAFAIDSLPGPIDASAATLTVTDDGLFTVDSIDATVQVSEASALDVSAATVTVTDDGALDINSIPEPVSTSPPEAPNGSTTQQSVGTSATQILGATNGRAGLLVQNLDGSNDVYIGFDSNVTANDGIRVSSSGGTYSEESYTGALYAIATGANTDLRIQEVTQ